MSADLAALVARLEAVAERLEKVMPGAGAAVRSSVPPPPPSASTSTSAAGSAASAGGAAAAEFQAILDNQFKAFVESAEHFSYPKKLLVKVTAGLKSVYSVVNAAPNAKKPATQELLQVMDDLAQAINESQSLAFEAEVTREGSHTKMIEEALPLFSFPLFVGVGKAFIDTAQTYRDAAQFYIDKVLVLATKGTDEELKAKDKQYAVKFAEFLDASCKFVCTNYGPSGLPWKEGGAALVDAVKGAGAAPAASAATPAPPKASPPPASSDPRGDFLKDIQKGLNITSRLRHVSKDEKRAVEAAAITGPIVEPEAKVTSPAAAPKVTTSAPVKKPTITTQKGACKVYADNYVDNDTDLNFGDLSHNYSLFIGNCKTSTVRVPNKIKAISIDGCERLKVYVDSVLTTVDFVNCKNVVLIVSGTVPTVVIDKSSGCIVALNESAKNTPPQLVTSNISECNVQMPNPLKVGQEDNDEIDDVVEVPISEQYVVDIDTTTAKLAVTAVTHG